MVCLGPLLKPNGAFVNTGRPRVSNSTESGGKIPLSGPTNVSDPVDPPYGLKGSEVIGSTALWYELNATGA